MYSTVCILVLGVFTSTIKSLTIRDAPSGSIPPAPVTTSDCFGSDDPSLMPVSQAQQLNQQLDSDGSGTCCMQANAAVCSVAESTSSFKGKVIMATTYAYAGEEEFCIENARIANYIAGIITTCAKDGEVGGTQLLNENQSYKISLQYGP